jgi:Tol biopolymer transport system component
VADEVWAGGEDSGGMQLFSPKNGWNAPLASIAGAELGIFNPDGSEMVYTSVDQTGSGDELRMETSLCRIALKDGARPSLLATSDGDWTVCLWTRDAKSIVYWAQDEFSGSDASDGNQLFVMPAGGGKARALGIKTLLDHDLVALSPNRSELAITVSEGRYEWVNKRLAVVDLETGSVHYLTPEDTVGFSPVWSPDGNRIAYCAGPQPLKESDVEFGGEEGTTHVNALVAKRRIWIRDREGAQPPRLLTSDDRYHDQEPLWSSGGTHILFTRSDAPLNDIESLRCDRQTLWLAGQDGANPIQVTSELYIDSDLGGPDERRTAFDWLR